MTDFVHLHVHSEYSLLDGCCRIEGLIDRAAALGQTAVAITDHGVMYGVVDFYKEAKKKGIKPIIGCEVYVARRTRHDRVHELDADSHHLVLLCKNEMGYKNLIRLVSMGFVEGLYIKPRVDIELLEKYSEGLIALSACLSGEVPKLILNGDYNGAKEVALKYRDIFGEDSYYLELQDHGIPEQKRISRELIKLSEETGIPLVVTNDAHYLEKKDAYIQDVLMSIQLNKTVDDPDRMKFSGEEFYIKSGDEMAALFPSHPEAVENTVKIAEMCNFDFTFGKYHLPEFSLPEGWDRSDEYLRYLAKKNFDRIFPNASDEYKARLEYELNMIINMGFADYFLIVSDFISYAKSNGIPVGPGRGSSAGSIVTYVLGITDVDPIKYDLYFERFLNPERVSMPDIDIDFCYQRRGEVIDYVVNKYGSDHVAQIVTFGTMAARGGIRDVGRALGMPYADVDVVAKSIPFALGMTIDHALKVAPQFKELYEQDPNVKRLVDTARAVEGMPRHASTHAAGVVITGKPVYEYVPLARNDESLVTQFPMNTLEELGLLKMDFLGLRNLTIISDAEKLIQARIPDFRVKDIPDDDKKTFDMLTAGKTSGVFQLESAGMTGVCMGLRPQSIEDIMAIVALYRPGPMDSIPRFIESKHNPSKTRYKHEKLKSILGVTYGCIVYQEQVMEIFRRLAGYSLGRADIVRRAMSKKKMDVLKKEWEAFIHGDPEANIAGCVANGVPEDIASDLFDEILDFANYAFPKAHAVSYGIISYQTAYLKCHYPREYMAALLTAVLDSTTRVSEYIGECREMGIQVLPPDVNESFDTFTVSGENIRFGLIAVKNVGRAFIKSLVEERTANGPFTGFQDFCERMSSYELNRRALESLIKCGAFDSMGYKRSQLLAVYSKVIDNIVKSGRNIAEGQINLFSDMENEEKAEELEMPDIPEFAVAEKLAMEKEMTGIYISGHPMDSYKKQIKSIQAVSIGSIIADFAREEGPEVYHDEQKVTIAGVVSSVKTKVTKNNTMMAYITLEDHSGSIELLAFSNVLSNAAGYLKPEAVICVAGKISTREDKDPQLLCDDIKPIAHIEDTPDEPEQDARPSKLYLKIDDENGPLAPRIKGVLTMFPGTDMKVIIYFENSKRKLGGSCVFSERLISELVWLLGEESVVLK